MSCPSSRSNTWIPHCLRRSFPHILLRLHTFHLLDLMPKQPSLKNILDQHIASSSQPYTRPVKPCGCTEHHEDLDTFIKRFPKSATKFCNAWKNGKRLCPECLFLVYLVPEHQTRCNQQSTASKDDTSRYTNQNHSDHSTLHSYFCRVSGPCRYHFSDQQYFRRI